ncbi:MAG: PEPxxWA-CTERM sorting domain-containing protein [Proteobacteria bacterium]|nr:PEPxxWA-CTERM sorting domain-containing protein [Pseudomonadota bacterium]
MIDDFGAVSNISEAVVAAVPEPATWALMLLGFGGLGATLRRRRRSLLQPV